MDALRFNPSDKTLSLTRVPVPKIVNPKQVLVKVRSSGVCGTDLHVIQGHFPLSGSNTLTLGHEFAGEVVDVGREAEEKWSRGDRVTVDPNGYCYSCEFCNKTQFNFCLQGGLRTSLGLASNGGFAEYVLCPAERCHLLDETLDFDQGALVEPLACIVHGWNRLVRFSPPQPDSRILVMGAGIIGNLWACVLSHHGCRNVTVTEPLEDRRKIASKLTKPMGYTVMSPEEAASTYPPTAKECELEGVDLVVDCTGSAEAFQSAIRWTRRGGTILLFGCVPAGHEANICPQEIFSKELLIFGTQIDPLTYSRAVPLAASIAQEGNLTLDKLGVEAFKVQDYEQALKKLDKGSISKAMFKFD